MPDLNFVVLDAEPLTFAAAPTLAFKLRIASPNPEEVIHTIALRCQVQLAAPRRAYSPEEKARLLDVFGEPGRWGETLRNLLWTHISVVVPGFVGETVIDLPVSCTYDFEVVGTKYFAALEDGEVPLLLLFSGTIFYPGEDGQLQVEQISWSKEARFQMPISCWQGMIAHYYPNTAWLRLHKDVFEQLYAYKARHGLPTWEDTVAHLLQASAREAKA
jgi:Family of unknown function (DUF6084)